MTRSLYSPFVVHVEHLLISRGDGGALTSLPIVVSDDTTLFAGLHGELGMDDFASTDWRSSVRCDPVQSKFIGCFNRAAGHRLYESLRASMGKQWRWLPPVRTRWFETVSGHAGRVKIPVGWLWLAWDSGLPAPASVESLARLRSEWGRHERLELGNDGMVAIDVSGVRGVDPAQRKAELPRIVERLVRDPGIWDQVGKYEGLFGIQVHGHLTDLLDGDASLNVRWKLQRKSIVRRRADVRTGD